VPFTDGKGGQLQAFFMKANSTLIMRVRRPALAGVRGKENANGPAGQRRCGSAGA
jgi:hypothetical protein